MRQVTDPAPWLSHVSIYIYIYTDIRKGWKSSGSRGPVLPEDSCHIYAFSHTGTLGQLMNMGSRDPNSITSGACLPPHLQEKSVKWLVYPCKCSRINCVPKQCKHFTMKAVWLPHSILSSCNAYTVEHLLEWRLHVLWKLFLLHQYDIQSISEWHLAFWFKLCIGIDFFLQRISVKQIFQCVLIQWTVVLFYQT